MDFGKPPDTLRSIQPCLTIYKQFIKRDPLVSYYALKHAVSEGIKAPGRDATAKAFLVSMLDELESMKATLEGEHALMGEVADAAHMEELGLKLFNFADNEDRNARFNRSMIKSFFTSFHIFTIVKGMGDLTEEIEAKRKYAMWKAVEIDRCLKNGIQPTPGPPGEAELESDLTEFPEEQQKPTPKPRTTLPPDPGPAAQPSAASLLPQPVGGFAYPQPVGGSAYPQPVGGSAYPQPVGGSPYPQPVGGSAYPQPVGGSTYPQPVGGSASPQLAAETGSSPSVPPEVITEAQKKCKFASSALDYDDIAGAIDYLTEALKMLQRH